MGRTGIVCEAENGKGELMVMVMKKKFRVNKKRLSVYIDGKELYPEDYDFDIVLESKDDRKKKKLMSKRHAEGVVIERTTED
jgi:DNA mismatch repair protein MutS2